MRMFEYMNEAKRVDIEKVKSWCDKVNCEALIVLHDKDEREPHYHCFVKLVADRELEDLAKQLNTEPQYINYVKKWKNALAYAFHLTEQSKKDGKYKYDGDAVAYTKNIDIDDIFKTAKDYDIAKEHEKAVEQWLIKYGSCEITKTKLLELLSAGDYMKWSKKFKSMQEYRIMKVRDRDMTVVYICGGAGSGKTTLAKFMASTFNYDYFVSGSGADILDGYDKEECIILDDLRADIFTKAELFKLTDNNTNSSVKSRFRNKDISYCKLMIITSVKTPHTLYNWETFTMENKDESFKQFARRLGNCFLWIDDKTGAIYQCGYDTDNILKVSEKKLQPYTMSQVFSALGISQFLGKDTTKVILDKINEKLEQEKSKAIDDLPF